MSHRQSAQPAAGLCDDSLPSMGGPTIPAATQVSLQRSSAWPLGLTHPLFLLNMRQRQQLPTTCRLRLLKEYSSAWGHSSSCSVI